MEEARLVVIESWDDVPLQAACSACPEIVFDARALIGDKHQQEIILDAMFTLHYNQAHTESERILNAKPVHEVTGDRSGLKTHE